MFLCLDFSSIYEINWQRKIKFNKTENNRDEIVQLNYRVDIGRDEGDDGERTKPGVSNGEEDITRNLGSSEVSGC
jgi:hypothetical protein